MKRRPWNDPAWRSPPRASGRGRVTSVKLMADYACELPLWGVDWWELTLSNSLLDDLADWQEAFDDGFDPAKGWRGASAREAWAAQAAGLCDRLETELGGRFELEVDLWPLESTD